MTTHYPSACNEPDCSECTEWLGPAKTWPGPEGFCAECHLMVAMENGLLMVHTGAFSKTYNIKPCAGSLHEPFEMDENVIDPWSEPDGTERPRSSGDRYTPGQSYGG